MISQVRSSAVHTYVYKAQISITENKKKIRRLATKHRIALLILSLYCVLRVLQNNIIHVPGVCIKPVGRRQRVIILYYIFVDDCGMGLIET